MHYKKNSLTYLVTLILLMCCTLGYAQEFEIEGLTYNVIDESNRYVEVSKVEDTEYTETVKIPSTVMIDGVKYTVNSIGYGAFMGCESLTSITIPSSVTCIGNEAFANCSSLTSINIPSSVTSIGNEAFWGCDNLTQIQVAPNNPVYDSRDNCNAIIETSSNTLISGCETTIIPNSVTSIGNEAFANCSSLTSITIPSSVTIIGDAAFFECEGLTSIAILSGVKSIGEEAFDGCSSLTSINIPSSVTSIGNGAFYNCSSLTSITLPSSVTSIGGGAFWGCSNLTKIKIAPDNPIYESRDNCNAIIETESNTLIQGCAKTIIPSSVTSIGNGAFYECSSLTSITIPSSVTSIGGEAFLGCSNLTSINIPSSVTSIGISAFWGCSSLTSITIPSSVTSIEESAFYECTNLTSITIPSSVTSIGRSAFYSCSSLTSINIPSSVTSIGYMAFAFCSSLTSINIPSSVKSIGESAFDGCSSLTSITIPSSVTNIGENAFWGCDGLTSITLPEHITNIDKLSIPEGVKIIRSTTTDNSNQESKNFKESTKSTFNVKYAEVIESQYNQGPKYHKAKNYNEALGHFKKAAAPTFQFTPAKGEYAEYVNAAYNHIKNGDMMRARQTYNIYKDLTGKRNTYIEDCLEAGGLTESLETKEGHARAQFYLGLYYTKGYGVNQDYNEAVKWWTKAAEQGLAEAQYKLGVCYDNGLGVIQNHAKAVKWWTKAAEQGDADAKRLLREDDKIDFDDEDGINIDDLKANQTSGGHTTDDAHQEPQEEVLDKAVVEVGATYPGGEAAILIHIAKNLRYPAIASEQEIQGVVTLRFKVEKDGSVGDVYVVRSLSPECDREAIRLVKTLRRFTPAMQQGKPVAVWFTIPIRFQIQ